MELKPGASVKGVVWQLWDAAMKVEKIMLRRGYRMIITAGSDGIHMKNSLHARLEDGEVVGRAIDWRSWIVKTKQEKLAILKEVQIALGADFDVILHEEDPEHYHMEYQPKEVA